jgi:hypothetical protein
VPAVDPTPDYLLSPAWSTVGHSERKSNGDELSDSRLKAYVSFWVSALTLVAVIVAVVIAIIVIGQGLFFPGSG